VNSQDQKTKPGFWRTGNIIALLIFFGVPLFAYHSCTSGYDKYVYFVEVNDQEAFAKLLQDGDEKIIAHGRRLKEEVILQDTNNDNGNGANQGHLRWYVCSGIDCDEGWQSSFMR
jgi:hypothetical protein